MNVMILNLILQTEDLFIESRRGSNGLKQTKMFTTQRGLTMLGVGGISFQRRLQRFQQLTQRWPDLSALGEASHENHLWAKQHPLRNQLDCNTSSALKYSTHCIKPERILFYWHCFTN